mmetsp:Transcript_44403/g.113432  ORF Transcript_44403/g.113432 Transcript_44403/m.113432 type:complete len:221 (+) Transcript_44403:340-1002(+)
MALQHLHIHQLNLARVQNRAVDHLPILRHELVLAGQPLHHLLAAVLGQRLRVAGEVRPQHGRDVGAHAQQELDHVKVLVTLADDAHRSGALRLRKHAVLHVLDAVHHRAVARLPLLLHVLLHAAHALPHPARLLRDLLARGALAHLLHLRVQLLEQRRLPHLLLERSKAPLPRALLRLNRHQLRRSRLVGLRRRADGRAERRGRHLLRRRKHLRHLLAQR